MKPELSGGRLRSIDAFRGLTFLVMVFVNELHGVSGIPAWMKHMPADADAMSFVDVVFPAFLFIVGLSIPFAFDQRERRGEAGWTLQRHIAARALALIVMGYFMVNAESGHNEGFMLLPVALWSLLLYAAFVLLWGQVGHGPPPTWQRLAGVWLLLVLAALYRGGPDGRQTMTPQWWGILGLIGWAYLLAGGLYQAARGRVPVLLAMIGGCAAYYVASHLDSGADNPVQRWLLSHDGHAAHTSIVLCGVVCSLLFFDRRTERSESRRFAAAALFAAVLVVAGALLRPAFGISKIHATPAWCFFSAAWCVGLFAALHALVDLHGAGGWVRLVQPAAGNPLVLYLLPFVIGAVLQLAGVSLPPALRQGWPGGLWAAAYAVIVLGLVALLDRVPLRMRL
jgi:heparan-alpha-glucosaminide N-acetyltransferase